MKKFLLSLVSLFLTVMVAFGAEVKIAYTGSTTTNTTGENDAALFGLSTDDWSIVGDKGANSNFPGLNKDGSLRLYYSADGSNTVTVTVLKEGAKINKISSITFNSEATSNVTITVGENTVTADADGKYAINATSFVIGNGNSTNAQVQIKSIILDVDGIEAAEVVHIANTAETAYTVAKAIELIDAGDALDEEVFVKGIISQIDEISTEHGNATYWISDDGTTTNQFECYRGKGLDGADFASTDDLKVGATVVVTGNLTKYKETYEFKQGNEIVSYVAPTEEEPADQVIYDWNFEKYGSTTWLAVNAEADPIAFGEKNYYPTTIEKWVGLYAETDKIRIDKNTGLRAYTKGTGDYLFIPGLKKGDIVEVAGSAGGGSGTDDLITAVTDNAKLTKNAWNDFAITMTADGDLGINEVFYQQTASNWYSIATIKVTRPAPTPELIANPAFDANAADIITVTTQGYARNIAEGSDQVAGLQPVTGWTAGEQTASDPGYTAGVFAYGSANLLNNKVTAPAAGPDDKEGVALGLAAVWAGVAQYTQDTTLPAGDYVFTYTVYNAVNEGEVEKNLFGFIAADGTEYLSDKKTFKVGEWETIEVPITLTEKTTGKISVGFIGKGGSGAAPHLFVDNVDIAKAPGIEVAIAALDKAIEAAQAELAKYTSGEGLFQYPEAELAPLATAIETATAAKEAADATKESINAAIETLNAAVEAFAPKQNAPDPEQAYTLILTTSEDESQLSATSEGVTIEAAGTPIYFIAQEDGTYALFNGSEYVNYAGSDSWTLNASSEPYGWAIAVVEGGYTITGKNGFLGTNAADKVAGKPCYGDKKTTNGNYIWAIEENDFPGAVDMTSLIKNPAYLEKGEDGTANYAGWTYSENAWKARNYEAPMNLITYSGNAAFEVSQTIESVPAGHYMLTVNAFYRAGSLDDEKAKVAAGTELEKELSFYAEVAGEKTSEKVMNLTEGATEKNYNDGAQLENGLYVPNSANDARAWYIAKEYNNALEFDVYEDGPVTIGLSKTEGLAGDYCPIGEWHLIRLGDAEAPAGITYAGVIEQTLTHPEQGEMGSTTTEQTLVITEAGEDLVNITFSGFTFPVLPFSVPSFTVENVAVETAEDGTITYAAGNFVVGIPMGMMTTNYNASLEGEQANADATPVIKIVLQNATTDTAIFGADQDAIDAYKKAHEEAQEPTAPEAPAFAELSTDGSTPQYLYNVEAKAFYLGANDWGTRASVAADKGYAVKITLNEGGNGTYNLEDQLANGNWNSADCQAVDQIWIDGAGRPGDKMWTVTAAEGLTFKLGNTNVADGFLAVVPSKGDTRLYISAEEGAQDVWAAVSEEEYNKYIEAYAEYLAELDEWNKTHYEVGDDIIALTPAAWDGQTGTYGGLAGTSYERYSASGSIEEGDVLTQTLEGLKNGTYEVKLELAASYTAGRGFECPTGNDLAVAFANETERNLAVVDRTWVSDGEQKVITLTAVVTDGTLKYGIKNITAAGNWYVANVLSLVYTSEEAEEATTYTIEIAEAENGTVITDVAADEEGSRVFITATPEEGYEIDTITVTDSEGTAIEVTANNAFTMPAGKVTVTVTFKSSIPDAINGINATSTLKNGKYLENNKVVIIRNGVKYGVNGAAIK
ncbi:MAG: hypothetical protein IJV33_01635 [Bacteroidaceae bacterium]|nr:hypothetical protein [Bacteroidaceae bacterium]